MYPYYRRVTGLHVTDINAIRRLYATRYPDGGTPEPPGAGLPQPAPPEEPEPAPHPPPAPPAPPEPPQLPPAPPEPDTLPPTLLLTYPSGATLTTTADSITVRGAATDNSGQVSVTWTTQFGAQGAATGAAPFTAGPIPLIRGTNRITVHATDASGNATWRAVTVTRR
jgi:hypothetical protein